MGLSRLGMYLRRLGIWIGGIKKNWVNRWDGDGEWGRSGVLVINVNKG